MTMIVNQALCKGCGICEGICPNDAIHLHDEKAYINQSLCTACEACVEMCPTGALHFINSEAAIVIKQPEVVERTLSSNVRELDPKGSSWGSMMLMMFGQHVLPRLTDILATYSERLIENLSHEHRFVTTHVSGDHTFRRHRKHRRRMLKYFSGRRW
jgi:NAD-dependent dihydropyrimidine dehydrogenase PreA subunit